MCHLIIDRSMGGDLSLAIIAYADENGLGDALTPDDRAALLRAKQGEWNEDDYEYLYRVSEDIVALLDDQRPGEYHYIEDNSLWACEDPEHCPTWRAEA